MWLGRCLAHWLALQSSADTATYVQARRLELDNRSLRQKLAALAPLECCEGVACADSSERASAGSPLPAMEDYEAYAKAVKRRHSFKPVFVPSSDVAATSPC